jgi:hypothetical protein
MSVILRFRDSELEVVLVTGRSVDCRKRVTSWLPAVLAGMHFEKVSERKICTVSKHGLTRIK